MTLRDLCKQYTDLTEDEVDKLENMENLLPYFCQLSHADIFIDCFLKDRKEGIVAAHGQPRSHSQYEKNIVGAMVLPENEPTVFFTAESGVSIRDAKGISQENRMVLQKTVPIRSDSGKVIAVLVEETDMTGNVRREQKLDEMGRTTAQLTETILDLEGNGDIITNHLHAGILVFGRDQTVSYVNPYGAELYKELGYPGPLTGMSLEQLCLIQAWDATQAIAEGGHAKEVAVGSRNLRVRFQRGADAGGFVMLVEDVSELKQKEQQLVEKSVMMREMHHRIKNNLQMISSILSMQQRRSSCSETKNVLAENISRINGIASVHEILIESEAQEVDLRALLEQLISSMKGYACTEEKPLDIRLGGDQLQVDSEQALAIVLIVNELLTNAIQHGYEEGQQGLIQISLISGTMYSGVMVSDDGRGFDVRRFCQGSQDVKQGSHLGLDLIRLLVEDKLKGELQIQSEQGKGTDIRFDFNNGKA